MYNVHISIFSSIILLVSLFPRIKGDLDVIKEQGEIASRPQLDNNFSKTPGEPVITTAITEDDEKFDDNELRKLFVQNFKLYENLDRERNKNGSLGIVRKTRVAPLATNGTSKQGVECLSCYANGTTAEDETCYKGGIVSKVNKIQCSLSEVCYTELNPEYIKRGCMISGRLNRTFYCKCPLCNDQPAFNNISFDYKVYDDWLFHNFLLQKPVKGMELICKVCITTGANKFKDNDCKIGKNVDYMVCGQNQLCYTNIDDEIDHVSRGCKTIPAFNSLYHFCNKTFCNNAFYLNSKFVFDTNEYMRFSQNKPTALVLTQRSSDIRTQPNTLFLVLLLSLYF